MASQKKQPTEKSPEIDTTNLFFVATHAPEGEEKILFMRPIPQSLTKVEALTFAAWIVALADDNDEFQTYLQAVLNA